MGAILKRLDFKQRYPGFSQGLFLVQSEKRLPKDQPVVNIGRIVSSQLIDYPQEKRAGETLRIVRDSISASNAVSLVHIDVLFTDYLAFDVVRELLGLARNWKICVLWPGEFRDGILKYAEPGSREYYECNLQGLNDTYYVCE